ncbi:MAG: phosphopantetheine-binding protein [Polaromonas sp.]|nr:phosphopantetheine-binding protein [Polaromonas sp.]
MNATFDRLCAILAKDYKLDPVLIRTDTPLESLGIDSLGVADLLFNVEDEFRITLPPEPVNLLTVGDVAQYIDSLVAAQCGNAQQATAATPAPIGSAAASGATPS